MKHFFKILFFCGVLLVLASCSSTKQLTISTMEPSPVDFSQQIKKIGIINNSKSSFVKSYSTRLEQLIVLEERWLAEKGTEAALVGLFNELAEDQRFDTVHILHNLHNEFTDFSTKPSNETWERIAKICEENNVDALFSLASHDTETQFSIKKTKMDQHDMMRDSKRVTAQEITLQTLIANGWRIYDPKQRLVVDEFTSNEQVVASAKGVSPIHALQAIDHRRETLLEQSKSSGSSYAHRMRPKKLDITRNYYASGTENFTLADAKIQNGEYAEAISYLKLEVEHPKSRISSRACYNIAVLNESMHKLQEAMFWANKSYEISNEDDILEYISALEQRQAQSDILKIQLASTSFQE